MRVTRPYSTSPISRARWLVSLITLALVAAMTAPIASLAAQTPVAPTGEGLIGVVPDSALAYAFVDLDSATAQGSQARALSERAGFGDPFEQMLTDSPFLANAKVAMVITSVPEAGNVDVGAVTTDPTAAIGSLDQGGYSVVIDSATPQDVYDAVLKVVQDNADQGGGSATETEYGGVTITSWTPKPGDDLSSPGAVAMVGNFVAYAMRAEDIQPLIDTLNGDTPSLSANASYQRVSGLLPAESLSHGYVDGPAILDALQAASPEQVSMLDTRMTGMLQAQTGYALIAEQDGFRLVTRSIRIDGSFPEMTPVDGSFFDKVRSDAVIAINGSDIDATGAVTMLAYLFAGSFVGQDVMATPVAGMDIAAAQSQVFKQAEQMLGVNLKTDLIDHLNGEFGISVSISGLDAAVPEVNALIVSHVDDPQVVSDTMARISLIAGAALGDQTAVSQQKVNGSTVNVVDGSVTGIGDVAFGVVGEDLVIALGSGLSDYQSGADNPMSSDPNYTAVMDHLPGTHGSIVYVNMPVLLDLVTGFTTSMESSATTKDADPACENYSSQEQAQAAYDADQLGLLNLDQNFNGQACEDYFAAGTPAASPVAVEHPYQNVLGLGSVTSLENGVYSSETFLLIGGD